MEGYNRIDEALDFFVSKTGLFEAGSMLGKPQRFLSEPLRGPLLLCFVSNHGDAPGFNLIMRAVSRHAATGEMPNGFSW
jgi:hypothetical protein